MVTFIDDHRTLYGVKSICAVVPIAPSTYFRHRAQVTDPTQRAARAQRDDTWRVEIRRVWDAHFQVYGPRKVWKQLQREGIRVARCTVRRLMRDMGLAGAVRGRAWVTTTQSQPALDRPVDRVARQFTATRPNQLWVSDFTYVATEVDPIWWTSSERRIRWPEWDLPRQADGSDDSSQKSSRPAPSGWCWTRGRPSGRSRATWT